MDPKLQPSAGMRPLPTHPRGEKAKTDRTLGSINRPTDSEEEDEKERAYMLRGSRVSLHRLL